MRLSGTWSISNGLIATLLFSTLTPAIELDLNDERTSWILEFDFPNKRYHRTDFSTTGQNQSKMPQVRVLTP